MGVMHLKNSRSSITMLQKAMTGSKMMDLALPNTGNTWLGSSGLMVSQMEMKNMLLGSHLKVNF